MPITPPCSMSCELNKARLSPDQRLSGPGEEPIRWLVLDSQGPPLDRIRMRDDGRLDLGTGWRQILHTT